jgi:hypothetical protein
MLELTAGPRLNGVQEVASSNLAALNAAAMGDALAKRHKNVIPT